MVALSASASQHAFTGAFSLKLGLSSLCGVALTVLGGAPLPCGVAATRRDSGIVSSLLLAIVSPVPPHSPLLPATALLPWPRSRAASESRRLATLRAQSAAACCEDLSRAYGEGPLRSERRAALTVRASTASQLFSAAAGASAALTADIRWEDGLNRALGPRWLWRAQRQRKLSRSHELAQGLLPQAHSLLAGMTSSLEELSRFEARARQAPPPAPAAQPRRNSTAPAHRSSQIYYCSFSVCERHHFNKRSQRRLCPCPLLGKVLSF